MNLTKNKLKKLMKQKNQTRKKLKPSKKYKRKPSKKNKQKRNTAKRKRKLNLRKNTLKKKKGGRELSPEERAEIAGLSKKTREEGGLYKLDKYKTEGPTPGELASMKYSVSATDQSFNDPPEKVYLKTHGLDLCVLCHKAVHKFYDEKTLGKHYNTLELLLESEKIQNHIKWAKKQQ